MRKSARILLTGAILLLLAGGAVWADRQGLWGRALLRLGLRQQATVRLSAGDFPAGATAPVGDVASIPLRPTRIGFTPRGSSASLLLAAGGVESGDAEHGADRTWDGLLKTSYALDSRAVVFAREEDLKAALELGGKRGGIDFAALSVDRVAQWGNSLRDAAPRVILLLGRSQGQEALAAVGIEEVAGLNRKRVGAYKHSGAHFFGLWVLARAGLGVNDVRWVDLGSNLEAGRALREGRVDAVFGLRGDIELAAKDRGGKVLVTSADAPHLLATVLVVRGDFAARYPDAVRRVLRGVLDASQATLRDPHASARLLGEVAPYLGDPTEAIRSAVPATLADNQAFFGLAGEAPVTYDELYGSAVAIYQRLGRIQSAPPAEDTRALGPLKYVAEARGP